MPKCSALTSPRPGVDFPTGRVTFPVHLPCLMSPRPDSPLEGGSLCPFPSVRKVGPALEHVVQVITCHFLQILERESEQHLRKASAGCQRCFTFQPTAANMFLPPFPLTQPSEGQDNPLPPRQPLPSRGLRAPITNQPRNPLWTPWELLGLQSFVLILRSSLGTC